MKKKTLNKIETEELEKEKRRKRMVKMICKKYDNKCQWCELRNYCEMEAEYGRGNKLYNKNNQ